MTSNLSRVVKPKLPPLMRVFENDPRVIGVWLFGSQAAGAATPRSDIDLAVLFDRDLTLDEQLAFEVTVCEVLGTERVDVVDLRRASLLLRFRAIEGRLLYERDYVRVSDFIEQTLIEYPDYQDFLERFDADYFGGMRQDYAKFRYRSNRRTSQDHRRQSAASRKAARSDA